MTATTTATIERRRLRVGGVVQGVGFRPAVHRLATVHGLDGWVLNDGDGVVIEIEGPAALLDAFRDELPHAVPPPAAVADVAQERIAALGARGFAILPSPPATAGRTVLVPPDVATCDDCLRELLDPGDRRYRYPFTTCSRCGPRYTIALDVPYDRARTTMAGFPLCPDCRREYEDPADRRFHAEPIACPACGPRLSLPLAEAVDVLRGGGILAVKGLGGWHLACDATADDAVLRLRERKRREEKPLAVLTADPGALAVLTPEDEALLRSPARPIVLVRRRAGAAVSHAVAPGSPWLGLMLPYTPLHHLLSLDARLPLVLTSGNLTDEPIAVDDEEALRRLGGIADAFLGHDRPIHRRCEDSVVRGGAVIRRSRGLAPTALALPVTSPRPLLAVGAESKSAFCVVRGAEALLSPHLGDLDTEDAYRAFLADVDLSLAMAGVEPEALACDLHPDYRATRWARAYAAERGADVVEVQHHHAHAAACLAEHGERGEALAIVLDGTGLGTDGTIWGGEVMRCDLATFERLAWLDPVPLPGGERAVREPWRVAAAWLERLGLDVPWEAWKQVRASLAVNAPLSSGAGRLFDAVAAIIGVRERVTYEGQAAIELEHLAGEAAAEPYPCRVEDGVIRSGDLVASVAADAATGRDRAEVAAAFHESLAAVLADTCAGAAGGGRQTVALSGGTLQNRRLARSLEARLRAHGLRVLVHRQVPPNDGGIAYGQAAVAAARLAAGS